MKKFRQLVRESRVEDEGLPSEAALSLRDRRNKESMPKLKEASAEELLAVAKKVSTNAKISTPETRQKDKEEHQKRTAKYSGKPNTTSAYAKPESYPLGGYDRKSNRSYSEEYESVPASKALQKAHEDERKRRGLPDPDYYLKLRDQKRKEIEDMKKEEVELDENLIGLGGVAGHLVGAAVGAGIALHHLFPKKHEKTPIEHGIDKAYENGDHKLYHSLKSHQHSELAKHYRKQAEHTTNKPDNYYKADRKAGTRNPAAKKGEMKPSAKLNLQYHNRDAEHHEKRAAEYAEKEKSGAKINESFDIGQINEKNVPTSPEKWAQAKAQAKAKFDVYPSAYANGWASKKYKEMGGGWKSVSEESELEEGYYKNQEIERQETERLAKQPPFTPDKPKKQVVAGKKPEGYSTARHLARQAMQKYKKPVKESLEESRRAKIVKEIIKKKKNEDKFNAEPIISDTVTRNT
jgi:hypothetical protein